MAEIYALLVGINDYSKTGASDLGGCLDDIGFYGDFLKDRYPDSLRLEMLLDSDATHDNIVQQFRSHLSKAGKDDVALFAYAGHGARWKSAPEFARFFPDGFDEGLVCYDSRSDSDKYDLADKEIAMLLQELSRNEPHVAVILDSCHSGSATRGIDVLEGARPRATIARDDPRPFETYLNGRYLERKAGGEDDLVLPESRHILLAACRRTQLALELDGRGSFSRKMQRILEATGGDLTYADLFSRCRAAMRVPRSQDPQFETYGHFNAYTKFLGSTVVPRTIRQVFYDRDTNKWMVESGAAELPTDPDVNVEFELHPLEGDSSAPVGVARAIRIGLNNSEIEMPAELSEDRSTLYNAVPSSLPVPPMPVRLSGDAEGVDALKAVVSESDGIEFISEDDGVGYSVEAADGVLRLSNEEGLIRGVRGYDEPAAMMMMDLLRHLVRFNRTLTLQNQKSEVDFSSVDTRFALLNKDGAPSTWSIRLAGFRDEVVEVGAGERKYPHNEIVLSYSGDGENADDDLKVRFEATNNTGQDLNVAVLRFTREFSIRLTGKEVVPPGGAVVELKSTGQFLSADLDSETTTYKFIVSTEDIDDQFLVAESGIERIGEVVEPVRSRSATSRADRMDGGGETEKPKYENEWFTTTFSLKIVRQVAEVGDAAVELAAGAVTIASHRSFKATVNLNPIQAGTRGGTGERDLLGLLNRHGLSSVPLSSTRDASGAGNCIELSDIENDQSLEDNPLTLSVRLPTDESERIVSATFDGEHFQLVGDSVREEDGRTTISIDHIPATKSAHRGLGKALKLYLLKTKLGQSKVSKLQRVTFDGGKPTLSDQGVAGHVSTAKNILVLVHGLLGDTASMAAGLALAGSDSDGPLAPFDLVLAFDYDSIGTRLDDSARELTAALGKVGVGASDDAKVTVLAHGMGGLVARWFVEQEGGASGIDHVILCGTPNSGSPLGQVAVARKAISSIATIALNMLGPLTAVASLPAILLALEKSKKVTVTLDQLSSQSELLKTLDSSAAPGVRYTAIGGDVSLLDGEKDPALPRLLEKVGKSFPAKMLLGDHHDVFSSMDSSTGVNRSWQPAPAVRQVACHHLGYFVSPAAIAAVKEALSGA